MNITNIVVDIDGTIADHSHRLDNLPKNPSKAKESDWELFNAGLFEDEPIQINIDVITAIIEAAAERAKESGDWCGLVFLTSRNWNTREETHNWLRDRFDYEKWGWDLAMRAPDDTRPAADFKYEQLRVWNFDPELTLVFEDNAETATKLREAGYTVFQVADNPW